MSYLGLLQSGTFTIYLFVYSSYYTCERVIENTDDLFLMSLFSQTKTINSKNYVLSSTMEIQSP